MTALLILWSDIAASYEGERYADAKDKSGDAVEEWHQGRRGAESNFAEGKNDVIHDDVKGDAKEAAAEPRMARKRQFATDEQKDGRDGQGDKEVKEKTKEF
jgi:hypothetical protein